MAKLGKNDETRVYTTGPDSLFEILHKMVAKTIGLAPLCLNAPSTSICLSHSLRLLNADQLMQHVESSPAVPPEVRWHDNSRLLTLFVGFVSR